MRRVCPPRRALQRHLVGSRVPIRNAENRIFWWRRGCHDDRSHPSQDSILLIAGFRSGPQERGGDTGAGARKRARVGDPKGQFLAVYQWTRRTRDPEGVSQT